MQYIQLGIGKMSDDTIGRFLIRLKQVTTGGDSLVDMYKIGEDIGLLDKIQTDHIVEILTKDGYIRTNHEKSKIGLTDDGLERLGK